METLESKFHTSFSYKAAVWRLLSNVMFWVLLFLMWKCWSVFFSGLSIQSNLWFPGLYAGVPFNICLFAWFLQPLKLQQTTSQSSSQRSISSRSFSPSAFLFWTRHGEKWVLQLWTLTRWLVCCFVSIDGTGVLVPCFPFAVSYVVRAELFFFIEMSETLQMSSVSRNSFRLVWTLLWQCFFLCVGNCCCAEANHWSLEAQSSRHGGVEGELTVVLFKHFVYSSYCYLISLLLFCVQVFQVIYPIQCTQVGTKSNLLRSTGLQLAKTCKLDFVSTCV